MILVKTDLGYVQNGTAFTESKYKAFNFKDVNQARQAADILKEIHAVVVIPARSNRAFRNRRRRDGIDVWPDDSEEF